MTINYIPMRQINAVGDCEQTEEIQVWDVGSQTLVQRVLPYGDDSIAFDPSLAWSPDGRYFAIHTQDPVKRTTTTRIIDARNRKALSTRSRHNNFHSAFTKLLAHCWSSDGLSLITVYADRNDVAARAYSKAHAKMDDLFEFSDESSRRGDIVEEQYQWSAGHLQKKSVLARDGLRGGPNNLGDKKTCENAVFSQDGKRLALIPGNPQGGLSQSIFVYDVATGVQTLLKLSNPPFGKALVLAPLSLADEKDAVALLTSPQNIEVWNYRSGRIICKMHLTQGSVKRLTLSPDGSLLASSSKNLQEGISLWDATTGHLLRTMGKDAKRENDDFSQIVFSPDSATLAVANEDSTITLWRVK